MAKRELKPGLFVYIKEAYALLNDIELLMRSNTPMNDGSPMHKAVQKWLEKVNE